jgi:hypothetical protein
LDPITEAKGMDALTRAREMRARVASTLNESPTRSQIDGSMAPGGTRGVHLSERNALNPPRIVDEVATGLDGLEPAVEKARARIALDGAVNQTADEARSTMPPPTHRPQHILVVTASVLRMHQLSSP